MAEPTEPIPTNGNGAIKTRQTLALSMAAIVALCALGMVGIALGALKWGTQDWTTVNGVMERLALLATTVAGGLLGMSRPTNGPPSS